ncbi:lamin tail domain-containing protein [Streptomyces californicus]|uniref:lamin tail domain-containing protein n=1 Tax=Streptomyces californicus TaxID=67351 RepID=UPI003714107E
MTSVTVTSRWTDKTWGDSGLPPRAELSEREVVWGDDSGAKNRFRFDPAPTPVPVDGRDFALGAFTHEIHPTGSATQPMYIVNLEVNLAFDEGTECTFDMILMTETPRDGRYLVELRLPDSVWITADGIEYTLEQRGFDERAEEFATRTEYEGQTNYSAPLQGSTTFTGQVMMVLLSDTPASPAEPAAAQVSITTVHHQGHVKRTQSDEYVEIHNSGTAAADLSGWTLDAGDSGQQYTFPAGAQLAPDASLRVYTNEIHPDSGGHSFGSGRAIWNDKGDTALLRKGDGTLIAELGYGNQAKP